MESIKIVESAKYEIGEIEERIKRMREEIENYKKIINKYCEHVYEEEGKKCKYCGIEKKSKSMKQVIFFNMI